MAETTLKPCPHCGSDRITVWNIRDGQQAVCKDCKATGAPEFNGREGPKETWGRAVEAWNRRALSASPPPPSVPVGVTSDILRALEAKAIEQRAYWERRQTNFPCIDDLTDDEGVFTIPDDPTPLFNFFSANGRYSEADWWLVTIRSALSTAVPKTEAAPTYVNKLGLTATHRAQSDFMEALAQDGYIDAESCLQPESARYIQKLLDKLCSVVQQEATPPTEPALIAEQMTWLPIEQADKDIAYIHDLGEEFRIGNSYPIWARDSDGRVFECLWADDGKKAYWWDIEGESPVDPVEFMPHPLAALSDGRQR